MTRTVPALAVLAIACSEPAVPVGVDDGFDDEHEIVVDIHPAPVTDIDFLFVIDSSGSMGEEQVEFAERTRANLTALFARDFQTQPNIHMGIISADMGAGQFGISGCEGAGDDGAMQATPRTEGCNPPDGNFIYDVDDGAGGRLRNYSGELADTFACISRLGIDGCGFEQPLESMRRALSPNNPANQGFLRDDAMLAIVFLTDEDDCSAYDTALFDTAQTDISDPLGPLSSFRCFEFGVVCDGEDPRAPGGRENCRPREDSPYITPVRDYVDFIRSIKPDPSMVVVGAMSGGVGPVEVLSDINGNPELKQSCASELGSAMPSVRLDAFVRAFPGRFSLSSICTGDSLLTETYRTVATVSKTANCSACVLGPVANAAAPDCRVYDATRRGAADEVRTPIQACADSGGVMPCYELTTDASCDYTDTGLSVEVSRAEPAPADSHLLVRCVTPALLSAQSP